MNVYSLFCSSHQQQRVGYETNQYQLRIFFFFYGVFENSVSVSYLPKGLLEKSWLFPLIRLGEVFKIKLNIYLESKKVLSGMFSFLINLIY